MSHHLKAIEQVSIGGSKIDFAIVDDEGNSVLKVVANLQVRLAEVEARLEAAGLVIAN